MESDTLQPLQGTVSSLHLPTCRRKKRTVAVQEWLRQREKEVRSIALWRAVVSECLATFFYVFLALLPTVTMETKDHVAYIWGHSEVTRCALAFGLCMGVLAHCFGPISGAQLNPAVTCALIATRKMSPLEGALYVLAQCGGSIAGSALLFGIAPSHKVAQLGVLDLQAGLGSAQGLAVEILMTFLLVFTIFASLDSNAKITQSAHALVVGFAVTLLHVIGIPLTGCGINPARALGPAFIKNKWRHHWIYWLGPLLGGVLAGLLHVYIFNPVPKTNPLQVQDDDIPKDPPPKSPLYGVCGDTKRQHLSTKQRGHANNAYEFGGNLKLHGPGPYKLVKVRHEDDTDEYGYTKTAF